MTLFLKRVCYGVEVNAVRVAILPVFVLLCGCSGAQEPAPSPALGELAKEGTESTEKPTEAPKATKEKPLYGSFESAHTVMVVCEKPDWCETKVTDTLKISEAADGRLELAIGLVQANAHTCTFEGRLDPVSADEWEYRTPEPAGERGACHLRLTRKDRQLLVRSTGCREYCGARASLHADFEIP